MNTVLDRTSSSCMHYHIRCHWASPSGNCLVIQWNTHFGSSERDSKLAKVMNDFDSQTAIRRYMKMMCITNSSNPSDDTHSIENLWWAMRLHEKKKYLTDILPLKWTYCSSIPLLSKMMNVLLAMMSCSWNGT